MNDSARRCPPGSLGWAEYRVTLRSGSQIMLGFSLSDPLDRRMAVLKQRHAASHLGLLVILDDPESTEEAILWLHQATSLTLIAQQGGVFISDEVKAFLPRYFAAFFDEIKEVAPSLVDVALVMPRVGDRTLH
jgi:hypothetical protein